MLVNTASMDVCIFFTISLAFLLSFKVMVDEADRNSLFSPFSLLLFFECDEWEIDFNTPSERVVMVLVMLGFSASVFSRDFPSSRWYLRSL